MFKTFDSDRKFIERKYHNPDEKFNPYQRMIYHGEGYDEDSGLDDEDILNGLKKLEPEIEELPHPVARAKAVKYVLENERLYIRFGTMCRKKKTFQSFLLLSLPSRCLPVYSELCS